jgi:hypothetical protein
MVVGGNNADFLHSSRARKERPRLTKHVTNYLLKTKTAISIEWSVKNIKRNGKVYGQKCHG